MKIIYKLFIFVLILRLMPIILVSMNIFPNVGLDDLGFTFDENSSVYDILVNVASPHQIGRASCRERV